MMRWRRLSGNDGLGAISTSFWKRRCSVHSRSPSATTSTPSPSTCTSMWRAFTIRRSTYTPATPKAACASRRQVS
jgi:hypothetical protein